MQAADCDVVYGFQERRKGDALESAGGKIAWYWISKLYSSIFRSTSAPCVDAARIVDALLLHRESNTSSAASG